MVKATAVTVLGQSLDASLKALLPAAIDACVAEGERFKKLFDGRGGPKTPAGVLPRRPMPGSGEDKDDKKRCRPNAFFLLKCVEKQLYGKCPTAKKVSSSDCTALDNFIATCKPEKKD